MTVVLLLVPLLLVSQPPLLDYPNHMARMVVLAAGRGDPILSRYYAAHWAIIPNLALDALIPPLLAVMPVDVAGRIAIGLAILLPVLGCLALNRAVFGRCSPWALGAALPAYNVGLRLGLLNFLIALGLALTIAAGWVTWRDRRPALAVAVAGIAAPLLFFCHIMGLALLALLLGCRELDAAWRARAVAAFVRRGAALALVFAVPALLFAASQVAGTWTVTVWDPPGVKLVGAFAGFICQSRVLDVFCGIACLLVVYVSLRLGHGETRRWLVAAWIILAAAYAVAPYYFKGTGFFATRFSVMATFLLFAGLDPRLPRRAAATVAAGLAGLFVVRMVVIALAWQAHGSDLAALARVLAPVGPGCRVLVAAVDRREAPAYWATIPSARMIPGVFAADTHVAGLMLTERRAFWPALFANADQQPLLVRPAWRDIAEAQGAVPSHHLLAEPATPESEAAGLPADWQRRFDYVLLLDAGGEPDLAGWADDRMTLLGRSDAAALFRIRAPSGGT